MHFKCLSHLPDNMIPRCILFSLHLPQVFTFNFIPVHAWCSFTTFNHGSKARITANASAPVKGALSQHVSLCGKAKQHGEEAQSFFQKIKYFYFIYRCIKSFLMKKLEAHGTSE